MNRRKKGFTLTELVIVIAVIGILAGVLIPVFSGVVFNANYSADEQDARSLTMQFKLMEGEKELTESDISAAVSSVFGEGALLAPRTAGDGYHYWYDYKGNQVVVKTTNEIASINTEDMAAGDPTTSWNTPLAKSLKWFNGHYLLDESGSDLANALMSLYALSSIDNAGEVYKQAVKDLRGMNSVDHADGAFVNNFGVDTKVIITNVGTFRVGTAVNASTSETVVVLPDTTRITSTLHRYDVESDQINSEYVENDPIAKTDEEVVLPKDVKIGTESLVIVSTSGTTVVVKTQIENNNDAIKESIGTNATGSNAENTNEVHIQLNDGTKVTVVGDKIYVVGANGEKTEKEDCKLEYSNKVVDYDVTCTEDGNGKVSKVGNVIYVAFDQGSFKLNAPTDTFVGEKADEKISSYKINWNDHDSDLISIDANGVVTINKLPAIGEDVTALITASAEAGGLQKDITISIVRINSASFNIESNPVKTVEFTSGDTVDVDLFYRGMDTFNVSEFFKIQNEIMVSCTADLTFEVGNEGILTIQNNVITLVQFEGTQTVTAKVGDYLTATINITVYDHSDLPFDLAFANTDKYMYKVGNANTLTLGTFFKLKDGKTDEDVKITVFDAFWTNANGDKQEINKVTGDLDANYTSELSAGAWQASEITFSKTGVAIIRIARANDELSYTDLAVEVVDGYNVKDYSEIKNTRNSVLLCDLENATTQAVVGNYTLYGNGFTITAPNYTASKGLISVANGTVDNLQLIGPIYPTVVWGSEPYWAGGIYTTGNATITNSYLYGFRAPLHMNGGTLTVSDTVLRNGTACSLYTQGGTKITLTNVTTMQSIVNPTLDNPNTTDVDERNKQVLGAGVLCWVCTPDVEINGYFNQYNWVKEADLQYLPKYLKEIPIIGSIDVIEIAFEMLFGSGKDYEPYKHTVDGTVYVNAGIVWYHNKCDTVTDNRSSAEKASKPYKNLGIGVSISGIGVEGTVYGRTNNPVVTKSEMTLPSDYEYKPTKQGVTRPTFANATLATKKPSGVDEYAYFASNTINVGVKYQSSYTLTDLDTLFKATKHGRDLVISKVTYTSDGVTTDVTNSSLTFDKVSSGYLTYTVVDNQLYDLDGSANSQENTTEHVVNVKSTMTNLTNATYAGAENCATSWKQSGFISKKYAMQVALTNLTINDYDEYGNAKTITIDSTSVSGFSVSAKVGGSAKAVELVKDGSTIYLRWTDTVSSKAATTMTVTFKYKGLNGVTVTKTQDYTISA